MFIQYVICFIILVVLAIPLGAYIGEVVRGEHVSLSCIYGLCERLVYRIMGIDSKGDMNAKTYVFSVALFNVIGFSILFVMLLIQGILPLNPEKISGSSWRPAFSTIVNFMADTSWQAYSGETALSYFSQMMGLTVQNSVSTACDMTALFAIIQEFARVKAKGLGNFWMDLIRSMLYILVPTSMAGVILLASQGAVQSFHVYDEVELLEPMATGAERNVIESAMIDVKQGAVTVDGIPVEGVSIIAEQMVLLGSAASQIAIKQLGTNGGEFFEFSSAHSSENPTIFGNLVEMLFLPLIPMSLCSIFGACMRDKRQEIATFAAMMIMLVTFTVVCGVSEQDGTPWLSQNDTVAMEFTDGATGGNMEGKETRPGTVISTTRAAWTTAAPNSSANSMYNSYMPLDGLVSMPQIQLGEAILGGADCGPYRVLVFATLAASMAGLTVGRTPEYLGKKIGPPEMRMAALCCLATPLVILLFSGIAIPVPSTAESLNNPGAYGLSGTPYTYFSDGGNNDSTFVGFSASIPFINVTMGLIMLGARFIPMLTVIYVARGLVTEKKMMVTAGTFSTCNGLFVFLLVFVVLLVGAPSFLSVLSLGPIVERFQMMAQG